MSTLLKISFLTLFGILTQTAFAQQAEYGLATQYSDKLQGTQTSSKELYDADMLTAAHRTLPFGEKVKVTNLENNKSVVVRINDRGPFIKGYVIDLSGKAAARIGIAEGKGTKVKVVIADKSEAPAVTTTSKSTKKPTPPPAKKTTPAKVKTKTATRSLGVSAARGYGIQVGAYKSEANALKRVEALEAAWFSDIHIKKSKTAYKVILKNYSTKEQAEAYLVSLKKKGIDGFVISMKK